MKRSGGGLLLYTPEHVHARIVDHPDPPNNYETLFVDLNIAGRQVLVGVIYRSPSLTAIQTASMFEHMEGLMVRYPLHDYVIMGDFNIDISNPSSPYKNMVDNLCLRFSLEDKVDGPTRVASTAVSSTSTKIDLLLCSPAERYSRDKAEDQDISDHRLCKTVASYRCPIPQHKTVQYRLWGSGLNEDFVTTVRQITFNYLPCWIIHDANKAVDDLMDGILNIVNQFFPMRSRRVRQRDFP